MCVRASVLVCACVRACVRAHTCTHVYVDDWVSARTWRHAYRVFGHLPTAVLCLLGIWRCFIFLFLCTCSRAQTHHPSPMVENKKNNFWPPPQWGRAIFFPLVLHRPPLNRGFYLCVVWRLNITNYQVGADMHRDSCSVLCPLYRQTDSVGMCERAKDAGEIFRTLNGTKANKLIHIYNV